MAYEYCKLAADFSVTVKYGGAEHQQILDLTENHSGIFTANSTNIVPRDVRFQGRINCELYKNGSDCSGSCTLDLLEQSGILFDMHIEHDEGSKCLEKSRIAEH